MSIFIITEYDDDRSDYMFCADDDEFGYFTDRESAKAAIEETVRSWRIHEYEVHLDSIGRRNKQIDRANKEKVAIEAAGLEYKYVYSYDTARPGPLAPVPTLEDWLANTIGHDYEVAEVKPAVAS